MTTGPLRLDRIQPRAFDEPTAPTLIMKRMHLIMRIKAFRAIGPVMLAGFVWGSSPKPAAAGELTPLSLNLERQQTTESLVVRGIGMKPVSNAFKKEPSPARR